MFTNDSSLAKACREIRVHGQSERYVHTRVGVGGRTDMIQCAIVLAKLERFEWEIDHRLQLGARYKRLMDDAGIERVHQRPERDSVFAQYTVFSEDRGVTRGELEEAGIPTAVNYPIPLNEQEAYRHHCCPDCTPVSHQVAKRVLSLPMHADLTEEMPRSVVAALTKSMRASA